MRKSTPVRNRWFTAVAITCLSGFALCGCARGSRDVATSLKDNAAREAVEAERKIAERKRGESNALGSKESLASKERSKPSLKSDKNLASASRNPFDRKDTTGRQATDKDSSDLAMNPSKKPGKSTSKNPKGELSTAEWAGDSLDRRVKTASEERELDEIDLAEPLLDSRGEEVIASDLFDEVDNPPKKKTDLQGKTVSKPSKTTEETFDLPPQDETSFDEAKSDSGNEYPWTKKSAVAERSSEKSVDPFARNPISDIQPSDLNDESLPENEEKSIAFRKKDTTKSDQSTLDEAQQLEAKARVQSLLTQSRSFVNKGELRSAYRVAQQAQRIADSEDLYFSAGEEQPADLVRSVLMKIRFEESKFASRKTSNASEAIAELEEKKAKPNKLVSHAKEQFSNLPDGWTTAGKQSEEDPSTFESPEKAGGSNNPWTKSDFVSATPHTMQIKPGPVNKTVRSIPTFPDSQDQWRSVANEPMSIGKKSTGIEASGFESAQGSFNKAKVHPATAQSPFSSAHQSTASLPDSTTEKRQTPLSPTENTQGFTENSSTDNSSQESLDSHQHVPGSLASADDWRNQDLADIAVSRSPLLVAPSPPDDPSVAKDIAADVMDDSLGIDVQEPDPAKQSESKLWMVFAAAAGACAMLFVRRRPATTIRPTGSSR